MSESGAAKRINLALQGGGAHGAFTWGVLDRLLEDEALEIAGVCGTSAGAMNAAVMAYGLARGGRAAAKKALRGFWREISAANAWSPIRPTPFDKLVSRGDMTFSPGYLWFDQLSRMFSPYELNPLDYNPLRKLLAKAVDFDWLRHQGELPVFICASNVKTGKIKVFDRVELTVDAVMASACLPTLFQAVEIDGEAYWDGGFMGNPPIFPLIYHTDCADVLIVEINPINIPDVPKTAREILDRMNEMSFNSSLMREMRTIAFVSRLLEEHRVPEDRYKRLFVHHIEAEAELGKLDHSSKLNTDPEFQSWLFELGRARAAKFLAQHRNKINVESSVDIVSRFL